MKIKKSQVMTPALILLLIGVFVFLVVIFIVPKLLGKSGAQAGELIDSSKDYDGDGIQDFYDKCDCLAGDEEFGGCPGKDTPTKGEIAIKREQECRKTIKKQQSE